MNSLNPAIPIHSCAWPTIFRSSVILNSRLEADLLHIKRLTQIVSMVEQRAELLGHLIDFLILL